MEAPPRTRQFARKLRAEMSLPEVLLWRAIKARKLDGLHFRKQHPFGPYVLDFYCDSARLCVEIDGYSHGVGGRGERDEQRDIWLSQHGIRTLRLSAELVLHDLDDAIRSIRGALEPL